MQCVLKVKLQKTDFEQSLIWYEFDQCIRRYLIPPEVFVRIDGPFSRVPLDFKAGVPWITIQKIKHITGTPKIDMSRPNPRRIEDGQTSSLRLCCLPTSKAGGVHSPLKAVAQWHELGLVELAFLPALCSLITVFVRCFATMLARSDTVRPSSPGRYVIVSRALWLSRLRCACIPDTKVNLMPGKNSLDPFEIWFSLGHAGKPLCGLIRYSMP